MVDVDVDLDVAYMRCSRCYILRAADSASPILTPVAPYSSGEGGNAMYVFAACYSLPVV